MLNNVTNEFEIPELATEFLFRQRPISIPGDLRPGWRIGLIVLLLHLCCRGGRTSLARLHVISWGIRTNENRLSLLKLIKGDMRPDLLIVRFEPYTNRAVDFAIGEGLIRRDGGDKIELTTSGKQLAEELNRIDSVFVSEKQFMNKIRQNVTETLVNRIFGWRI